MSIPAPKTGSRATRCPFLPILSVCRPVLAALALGGAALVGPSASAAKWDPVEPADLAASESTSFPGVDVEILLSTHEMEEEGKKAIAGGHFEVGEEQLITRNFIRAKVYTAKGVEDLGKFRILFHSGNAVAETAARVVKNDGTSRELNKADIFESVVGKVRGQGEMKQVTFVFPGLEPGDVVEYRWTARLGTQLWLESFFCQDVFPIREYHFRIGEMRCRGTVHWLNCPKAETNDRDGFEIVLRNLPAFEDEEYAPPHHEIRGVIYVAKTFPMFPNDMEIWKELSVYWGDEFNMATRPTGPIKKKAEALAAGAATDDEKLRLLYGFCQNEILNTGRRTSETLQAEIEKHRWGSAYSPEKTLANRWGRTDEINRLFAALARALGFEVRLACNASREVIFNVAIPNGWAFIYQNRTVAVKVGGEWRYFDPGFPLLPYGMTASSAEGATTLLCNTKKLEQGAIGASKSTDNRTERKGRFRLDGDGTLEGEVEQVFRGHLAVERKDDNWAKSLEEATKRFTEEITNRLPNAEVSRVTWSNLDTYLHPLTVRYHVRVPGYAEQVGKRLVFAPGFFEAGRPVVFAAAERKFPIVFPYPWEEHDDIEIVLPEGYALDKPSAPTPVGELTGPFGAAYNLQYVGKTRTFSFRRDFTLGANGAFAFRQESYPALKNLFELLRRSDTHSIMLKPKEKPAATAPAADASQPAAAAQQ
ncbi:MAG TPA: DUF3857 domain-containing protein [Opitutaceae bacterium]|nr:DUF3857 domain-containing protein [Opitutaceae bacterium]